MLYLNLFSTVIIMLTALLNLLTAYLHLSCSLAAQELLLLLILFLFFLSIFLMQEITSIFIPYTGKFWNSLHLYTFSTYLSLKLF